MNMNMSSSNGNKSNEAESLVSMLSEETESWKQPHAFHLNLPSHHLDDDGIPLITKYAFKKSRHILAIVESLEIHPDMFFHDSSGDEVGDVDMEGNNDNDNNNDDDDEEDDKSAPQTLAGFTKLCLRLQSQLSALESLKHSGLTRLDLSRMVLKLLKLVTATITFDYSNDSSSVASNATIHQENVGYIYTNSTTPQEQAEQAASNMAKTSKELEEHILSRQFALPSPAREVLLSILVNVLSNKGPLRAVSNAAIYPAGGNHDKRFLLIVHWRSLLVMLLRTAPYLNEHKVGAPPMSSNSRQNTILKRTVHMIRDARHFFDQGIRPNENSAVPLDDAAIQLWDMVKTDVMFHSHTNASYRSLLIFYLFQPSRCTSAYYLDVLPTWLDCWSNIDRCPEVDFLWLALFCRARKHLPADYDWGPIRRRLLTHAQYWLLLPIGGGTLDKSFPRASTPRSRSCPARLKVFTGSSSSYEEGIDFVAKIAKLLAIGLGTGQRQGEDGTSEGSGDVLRFLSFVTPYFNPSNIGSWTFTLGAFLHYFSYEICCRIGAASSMECLKKSNPSLVEALHKVEPSLIGCAIPPKEIVALLDKLLPLCQQSLYSKNAHVGRAGEASMLYFAQIDPARVTPSFIDFAMRALGVSAVNLAHQAPAAISALTRLLQPALRSNPSILLAKLPEILRLSLAGIDSNDQNKSIRTLILCRSLTSWFSVGKHVERKILGNGDGDSGTNGTIQVGEKLMEHLYEATKSPEYVAAVQSLPESSLLRQGEAMGDMDLQLVADEASSAMCDWVLEFLDRIFALFRATGEREKVGKTSSGTASRHANVDVQHARNFSRVLRETLMQTFSAMDDTIHKSAVSTVVRFLAEESLPNAAKDVAYLCEAVASARPDRDGKITSPGLKALLPILLDDLAHSPTKTCTYRLRCLGGAIRACGHDILHYQSEITGAIDFALQSKDKHVYKAGCKLLRHVLAALCESKPLAVDMRPQISFEQGAVVYGRSAQLSGNLIPWHTPKSESVTFAWNLMNTYVLERIQSSQSTVDKLADAESAIDIPELRRVLRVVRYALRGAAGIMLDSDDGSDILQSPTYQTSEILKVEEREDVELFPYERAMQKLLKNTAGDNLESVMAIRGRISFLVTALVSLIASETFKLEQPSNDDGGKEESSAAVVAAGNGSTGHNDVAQISRDTKICKEVTDISLLLLTRRGATFRSQEGKTIWKAQKQVSTDFALLALADHTVESLQRSQLYGDNAIVQLKDGEDAGKTLPRRLLVSRIRLFHESLQRTASFEVPRRLRRLSRLRKSPVNVIFSTTTNAQQFQDTMLILAGMSLPLSMDLYEGLIDGLFSLCCHSNTQVRASSIGVVEYAITRFGWLVPTRVPRLLGAIRMEDGSWHGKFGVPSCSLLVKQVDSQGKRKRLSEALKGVCAILATARPSKHLLSDEKIRCEFVKTICGTDGLVALMPAEEMQKMVHYLHNIFSPFRMKFYNTPRSTAIEQKSHTEILGFLLDTLSNDKQTKESADGTDAKEVHWRKLLMSAYFLTVFVDENDIRAADADIATRLWSTCFRILENEYGQPLQRVTLGLFGRLVLLAPDIKLLREQLVTATFCESFCKALVYDHKEDTSIGGGHDAQWSTGVADFIRDSARNIAPKSLFPFQRTNQSSGTFKVSHAQMVEHILKALGDDALVTSRHLLDYARQLASAPPSEDQRNQQCTVAELFAGICRAMLQMKSGDDLSDLWVSDILPFLDEVYPKMPTSLSGAYFDALRFSLQFASPDSFYPMTLWLFNKVDETLWQPSQSDIDTTKSESTSADATLGTAATEQGTEGFTAQSKWLYLCSALLIELDETEAESPTTKRAWYSASLSGKNEDDLVSDNQKEETLKQSWKLVKEKLLPKLTGALGHPYESCRDHISGCLFRICHCHRKMSRESASRANSPSSSSGSMADMTPDSSQDPGRFIVEKLSVLQISDEKSYKVRYNSLNTVRRFFSYCIHLGEAKHEYSDYLISLLPLAFHALRTTVEGDDNDPTDTDSVAKRTMEADIVKGYRYTIAEISVASVVSYNNSNDISRVLKTVEAVTQHKSWQIRHAAAHFLRCFQGAHKFMFTEAQAEKATSLVASMLSDERREVSSAAMAAITGILAALPIKTVSALVKKYAVQARKSKMKRKKGKQSASTQAAAASSNSNTQDGIANSVTGVDDAAAKEEKRARMQQTSVFFLCASVLAQPYDTPKYVPVALAAISNHSFERNAPLSVRETVKKCCAEYKRTHMSDNWEVHRQVFTQEQLESLEDVVSSPHYYA